VRIEFLDERRERDYEDFLLAGGTTLLYASNKYRKLLKKILGAEDRYFIAVDIDNRIVGALPAFLKRHSRFGNIMNSLPFYGGNGAIIEHEGRYEAEKMLLDEFYAFAKKNRCISTTIISSPFEADNEFYEKETDYAYRDERIGQLTKLPPKNLAVLSQIFCLTK